MVQDRPITEVTDCINLMCCYISRAVQFRLSCELRRMVLQQFVVMT